MVVVVVVVVDYDSDEDEDADDENDDDDDDDDKSYQHLTSRRARRCLLRLSYARTALRQRVNK